MPHDKMDNSDFNNLESVEDEDDDPHNPDEESDDENVDLLEQRKRRMERSYIVSDLDRDVSCNSMQQDSLSYQQVPMISAKPDYNLLLKKDHSPTINNQPNFNRQDQKSEFYNHDDINPLLMST